MGSYDSRCQICILNEGSVRCKCTYKDIDGEYPSIICDECWKDHICLTRWIKFRIKLARKYKLMCPYNKIPYRKLPGYFSAYGCPICKSICMYHLKLERR